MASWVENLVAPTGGGNVQLPTMKEKHTIFLETFFESGNELF